MNCTAFNLTPSSPFFPEKNSRLIARTRTHDFGFTRKRLKRCRMVAMATSLELELPLLPFSLNEVLVPSESKTLHLYEARYLGLLEESLTRKNKLFVHFVLDPIIIENSTEEASFAARNGCLVFIENVERLEVGALVSIRGIGRVKIVKFVQADPYLKGVVIPLQDRVPDSVSKLHPKVMQVKEALYSLNSLEIKLKAPKEAQLQTRIANSLMWTEKELLLDCNEAFFPSLAERVSFAALQPVSENYLQFFNYDCSGSCFNDLHSPPENLLEKAPKINRIGTFEAAAREVKGNGSQRLLPEARQFPRIC